MPTNQINELADRIISLFKDNLSSILCYGSTTENPLETNDVDIIIILKNKHDIQKDMALLKKILVQEQKNIDTQLMYEKELANGNVFSLDTHGPFIVEELKKAIPLYGDNPFIKLNIYNDVRLASVIQKLQYYVFRARQASLGNPILTKDKNGNFHRKKLKMAMLDLLIAKQVTLNNSDDIIKTFIKYYPKIITKEFQFLLDRAKPLESLEALPIYEALYDEALSWINKVYPEKQKPGIAKEKGIFFEYLLPKKTENIPFIILCDGLPSVPYKHDLINLLANNGYGVLYPRYQGTWESDGTFLAEKPGKDISYLAMQLRKGIILGKAKLNASYILLLGTSFGGSVALSLAADKNVDLIIALSPVLDFQNFPNLDSLKNFLQNMYSGSYRFTEESWKKLSSGHAVPSSSAVNKSSASKIFLFGGGHDKEVPAKQLQDWGEQQGIKTIIYPNLSHLSFSKIEGRLLDDILKLLNFSSSKLQQHVHK